jgi:hypothetical protein
MSGLFVNSGNGRPLLRCGRFGEYLGLGERLICDCHYLVGVVLCLIDNLTRERSQARSFRTVHSTVMRQRVVVCVLSSVISQFQGEGREVEIWNVKRKDPSTVSSTSIPTFRRIK